MNKMMILAMLMSLLLASTAYAGPAIDDIKTRGSRNTWIPVENTTAIERLADYGFNAVTIQTNLLKNCVSSAGPDDPFIIREEDISKSKLDMIRLQARQSAEYDLLYMPYINQVAWNEVEILKGKRYRRVVNHLGVKGGISPCPLERKDWFGFQLPQMLAMLRIMEEEGCEGGIMLEFEAYNAYDIYPGYHTQRQHLCYCDYCWRIFTAKLSPNDRPDKTLKPAERYPWLSAQGLLWKYEQSEREELVKIMRELAVEVRKVKPDCVFGMYPVSITWYNDAITEGLGSEQIPFLAYSATEYYTGHSYRRGTAWDWCNSFSSTDHVCDLRTKGLHCLYTGGLSVGAYWPQRMGLEMAQLLKKTDGYWLYYGGTLLAEDGGIGIVPKGGSEWQLREQPSLYIEQIKRANEATSDMSKKQARSASTPAKLVWKDVTFKGPEAESLQWDIKNPPAFGDGHAPSIDRRQRALIFDLNSPTPEPKVQTLDYSFQQEAKASCLYGAYMKYEGPAEGVRIGLGWSWPEHVEGDGRRIFRYVNWLVQPEDGWRWLVRPLGVADQDQQGWTQFLVQANPGKVSLRSLFFSPSAVSTLDSPTLHLKEGGSWGRVTWKLAGAERSYITVDVYEAETDRQLYADVPNGFDLGDITRIYDIRSIKLVFTCHVPAGNTVKLRSLHVGGAQ